MKLEHVKQIAGAINALQNALMEAGVAPATAILLPRKSRAAIRSMAQSEFASFDLNGMREQDGLYMATIYGVKFMMDPET